MGGARLQRWKRVALSLLSVTTIVAVGASNMPASVLRARVIDRVGPFLNATGLEQNWEVFAPPRALAWSGLEAEVAFADGTSRSWQLPTGGPLLRTYADYRWRKLLEYEVDDSFSGRLGKAYAGYVARRFARDGSQPIRVTLIRRWRVINPPGAKGPSYGPPGAYRYFSTPVDAEMLAG
jgi:hypothetical protein